MEIRRLLPFCVERSLLKLLLTAWFSSRLLLLAPLVAHPLPQALNRWDVVHYLP
jgi:hypothetical protein